MIHDISNIPDLLILDVTVEVVPLYEQLEEDGMIDVDDAEDANDDDADDVVVVEVEVVVEVVIVDVVVILVVVMVDDGVAG